MYDETFKQAVSRWAKYWLEKVMAALGSRKLWAAIVASIIIVVDPAVPPEYKAVSVAGVWAAYIAGTAIEDYGKTR